MISLERSEFMFKEILGLPAFDLHFKEFVAVV